MPSTLANRLRERRKRLADTNATIDIPEDTMESTQPLETSQEMPSDAEIEEAENLKKDLTEKHKEKRRELSRQFRSSSKEDLRGELKTAKARSKATLERSLRAEAPAGDQAADTEVAPEPAEEAKSRRRRGKKKEAAPVSAVDGGVAMSGDEAEKEDDEAELIGEMRKIISPEEDAANLRQTRRGTRGKSLAASMREKMLAKRAAGKALEEEAAALERTRKEEEEQEERLTRRFRGQRDAPMGTRFDDEGTLDEDTFRLRSARKEKDKEITIEELRENMAKRAVTEEEAFDFFTRIYEKEPEPLPAPAEGEGEAAEGAEREPGAEEADEEEPLIATQRYKSALDFVGVGAAHYVAHQERVEKEEKLLYTPAVAELPIQQKIEVEPRYVAEEGLYVGEKPIIATRNRLRLENRLVQEGSTGWFGEDGEIFQLPNPLKEIPYRPVLWDDQDNPVPEELRTHFVDPIPMEFSQQFDPAQGDRWQLEVNVHSVAFTHHHLFSREHVLAERLRDLMERYEELVAKDNVDYCAKRIAALKRATGNLENQIGENMKKHGRSPVVEELERRAADYRLEIQKMRKTKLTEEGNLRTLISSIQKTWVQVKHQRSDSSITNTSVKMEFRKETFDKQQEEEQWREEMEEEVMEERLLREEAYIKEKMEFDERFAKWQEQQTKKQAARERDDRRRQQKEADEVQDLAHADEDAEMEEEDLRVLAEEDLEEPEPPLPFDEEATRERILAGYREHRRPPGKAQLVPSLLDGATLTPDSQCERAELQRRNDLGRFRYFVKVFFNHKEVCATELRDLGTDFSVTFTTILPIQIVQYPEIIHLQLFEKAGFSSAMLAEVYVPTPDRQTVGDRSRVEGFDFSSLRHASHRHAGVGSGGPFVLEGEEEPVAHLATAGRLFAAAAWSADENGLARAPPEPETADSAYAGLGLSGDAVTALGASSLDDLDKVLRFVSEANLDPNDPTDARLLQLLQASPADLMRKDGRVHVPEYFRLDHLQEEFAFATEMDMAASARYRLIMLRDQEHDGFRNVKIPATEKEVPADIFKKLEALKDAVEKKRRKREQVRGFEARRLQIEEFNQRIRTEVMARFRLALHQKSLKEVVIEEEIPPVTAILPTLLKLVEIQRPLNPIRQDRKKIPQQNISQMRVEVLVSVASAQNVPTRADEPGVVNPFVEVVFQEQRHRTPVADGPNPSWNAEFHFAFTPPPEAASLETVSDMLDINLYDEVVFDVMDDDRQRGASVHQRIERHLLGCLSVPFPTIFLNTKVDGKISLILPPHLLGYTLPPSEREDGEPGSTMLSCFITLDPAIQPPDPLKERFDSAEEEALLNHADAFTREFEKAHPERQLKTTVVDMHCKEVFVTRYLAPLNPPEEVLALSSERNEQLHLVARYVSMVPFVSDAQAFPGMCDVWSSCDQFLKLMAGDEEEHSVLLCNYFLQVLGEGSRVYLCLGNAVPEGPTAYVLTIYDGASYLWDSALGRRFSTSDVNCPMRSIACLINQENIWANMQSKDQPWEMRFDVTAKGDWRPLFGGKMKLPQLSSVQPSRLTYSAPDQRDIDSLRFQIDSTLRERFMAWRKGQVTKWHYEFMRDLGDVLENLEKNGGRPYSGLAKKFDKYTSRYTLFGFPLNMPYTEMERIVQRVQSTGVHATTARRVDFAIAVYVKSYANTVVSIWIYVASLINKQNQ